MRYGEFLSFFFSCYILYFVFFSYFAESITGPNPFFNVFVPFLLF